MPKTSINIDIGKYRKSPGDRQWDLPAWGHPLSLGVLPLFITVNERLIPVGSAFTVGGKVTFILSAAHNIYETWKHEARLSHLLTANELPKSVDLKECGLFVLHQQANSAGEIRITVWPLESVDGAPPTDVVFGYPQFQTQFPTLVSPISFDLPPIGELVWSIGYTDFRFPEGGIPLSEIRDNTFNWQAEYSHRLVVVEGCVERIFTQRFAARFVEGACFVFDAEIHHGQSGGPVMYRDGTVCGVNSAGATHFFDRPASIASLLYPTLFMELRFGMTMGPLRMNAKHPLIALIEHGSIRTDGSEERVAFGQDPVTGKFTVNPRSPIETAHFVHDDFAFFQEGRKATVSTRKVFRVRRTGADKSG